MRPIGFSSGALAYADFRRGVAMLYGKDVHAVELSALRRNELRPLIDGLADLNLAQFNYIAVHAPSEFEADDEKGIVDMLQSVCHRGWHVVLHPDAIHNPALWRRLGELLCVENSDKRKPIGRTAFELAQIFSHLPEASFCFDIGHARQVDSTMTEAHFILKQFGQRLRQVHVSEVNTRSKHDPLSMASILAFQEVADLIPDDIPLILETPVPEEQITFEIGRVREAIPAREEMFAAL
jgi:endonuclease IV